MGNQIHINDVIISGDTTPGCHPPTVALFYHKFLWL